MILGITNITLCTCGLAPLVCVCVCACAMLNNVALNVLSPFLAGFMIPGKPIGVMVFKVFSTITLGQA